MSDAAHSACPTHCCKRHGCKYGHTDCPVDAAENDASLLVQSLRAQVAMLREALQFVGRWEHLHASNCAASVSMDGKWQGQCQCHVSALAATEADAIAWLERQRKMAAAEALDNWADSEPVLPGDPPASIVAYFHDEAAASQCLRAAVTGTLKAAKKRAAELRKEAGCE